MAMGVAMGLGRVVIGIAMGLRGMAMGKAMGLRGVAMAIAVRLDWGVANGLVGVRVQTRRITMGSASESGGMGKAR